MTTDTAEREEALTDLVEERVLSRREQATKDKAAEEAEAKRLETLQFAQKSAKAALATREAVLPSLVETLTRACDLADQVIEAHRVFVEARTRAQRTGGDLTVTYPPLFALEGPDRRLMERVRVMSLSLGGKV